MHSKVAALVIIWSDCEMAFMVDEMTKAAKLWEWPTNKQRQSHTCTNFVVRPLEVHCNAVRLTCRSTRRQQQCLCSVKESNNEVDGFAMLQRDKPCSSHRSTQICPRDVSTIILDWHFRYYYTTTAKVWVLHALILLHPAYGMPCQ
jgi:hypothetical protein